MPMVDAYIPQGALPPEAQDKLLARLTDPLLQHEGVDPANQAVRRWRGSLFTTPRSTSVARQQPSPATDSYALLFSSTRPPPARREPRGPTRCGTPVTKWTPPSTKYVA